MRAIAIMYHDVVERGRWDESGFPGADAALYKLEREQFAAHLKAIAETLREAPVTVPQLRAAASSNAATNAAANGTANGAANTTAASSNAANAATPRTPRRAPLLITFDDGGQSAYTSVADMLEGYGWRGHFFVTAGRVDAPAFLTRSQIRELHARGHVIGSHSYSHPARMSHCSAEELLHEWSASVQALADILGERVVVASVPGGYYSREVAERAAEAGIETLFTSEPTARVRRVGSCLVLGRYTIQRWMSARAAASLAAGGVVPRVRQVIYWNAKKTTKALGGQYYLKLRKALLSQR